MSDNPYAVSAESTTPLANDELADLGVVGADDRLVWVTASASLPKRCIRTNADEDLVEVSKALAYVPLRWIVAIPMTGGLALPLLFLGRQQVTLNYWISRGEQARFWFLRAFCIAVAIAGPLIAAAGQRPRFFLLGSFTMWAGVSGLILVSHTLRVVSHEDGVFKIKGCSEAFLRSLKPDIANG